jgi:ankyrin repeat protein
VDDTIMSRQSFLVIGLSVCVLFLILGTVVSLLPRSAQTRTKYQILHAAEIGDIENLKNLLQSHPTLANATDDYGESALHKSANKDIAQLLITAGADIDANQCGWTPLHSAKNRAVTEVLIANGADVNARSEYWEETPLHYAEKKDIADLLIAKGADVNAKNRKGETPLYLAIDSKHRDVAELLVEKGAEVDIFVASALGLLDRVRMLLGKNHSLVNTSDLSGCRPLHRAAAWRQKEVVVLLIANGADVNAQDKDGQTALHKAAERGYQDVADLLITKGANVDIFLASALGLTNRVEEFLKANPQLAHAIGKSGTTPLHNATRFGHPETVRLLIANGADLEARRDGPDGIWTPLATALSGGHRDTAELLVMAGANVSAKNVFDSTLLHLAADRGWKDMAEFLIAKGANVNAKDEYGGWTPLHLAAEQNHTDIVKLLIDNGAKINEKDKYGQTPLDIAVAWGRKDTTELLRKHGAK